jgi:hypothetical protein
MNSDSDCGYGVLIRPARERESVTNAAVAVAQNIRARPTRTLIQSLVFARDGPMPANSL